MAFLCAVAFLSYFDRVCIVRAQGDIQHDLHITDRQMGLILSVFWLGYALFEIPGGWMGDRFGARRTLTRIVVAWSAFTALSGMAAGFTSLFVYRLLFGAGEAARSQTWHGFNPAGSPKNRGLDPVGSSGSSHVGAAHSRFQSLDYCWPGLSRLASEISSNISSLHMAFQQCRHGVWAFSHLASSG